MQPNPLVGVMYHWIGGLCSASNFIPFRPIKRWSWEIYWIIQGVAAWLIAPICMVMLLVPDFPLILHAASAATLWHSMLWGAMWGIGGLTFGLSIRYLGIALGYAIALGFCTAFGTLMPPVFRGEFLTIAHQTGGQIILFGVALCMVAIAINGMAGYSKEKEISEEDKALTGERDYSFRKGLAVAVFSGIMSSCFAYGLSSGKEIAAITKIQLLAHGKADLWQNLPVLVVVLWGGFTTNFIWSAYLIWRNGSVAQFIGSPGSNPMGTSLTTGQTLMDVDPRNMAAELRIRPKTLLRNYLLASSAGIIWYFQFFFYSMGQTKMGKYDFSSWALHMASIIIFATLWGIILREWRDTSRKTKLLVSAGLFLLILSTIIVGIGNYISAH